MGREWRTLCVLIVAWLTPTMVLAQGNVAVPPPEPVPVGAGGPAAANLPPAPYPGTTEPATPPAYQPPPPYPQPPAYGQQPVYVRPPVYGPPVYGQPVLVQPPPYVQPAPQPATADATVCLPTGASKWFVSAEALWLERTDDRDVVLGNAVTNTGGPSFIVDQLTSGDELFPLEAGVRFQIGYRMSDNVAIEMTYWGLQQWSVGSAILGDPIGESVLLFSPWTQTDFLIGGFDNSLSYSYRSRVNNVEVNERFGGTGGMYWSVAGLWGIRYLQVSDQFSLSGSDLATGDFENIDIKAVNNLVGPQIGVELTDDWKRFQLSTEFKAGIYANFVSASYNNLNSSGAISGNPAGFVPVNQSQTATGVAGVFEISLIGRYRVTDHLWIRGGWNDYFIAGLALGPRQLGEFAHNASISLDGPSLGIEASW